MLAGAPTTPPAAGLPCRAPGRIGAATHVAATGGPQIAVGEILSSLSPRPPALCPGTTHGLKIPARDVDK
jgi:hypothetical protein